MKEGQLKFGKITNVEPANFDVVLAFTGLLLFRFDENGKSCEIGIHRKANPKHRLQVSIELMRRIGENAPSHKIGEVV